MADASMRRALEETQVELRALKERLASWPAVSTERMELERALETLTPEVQALEMQVNELQRVEVNLRDTLTTDSSAKWWRPPLVPVAMCVAVIGALWLANRSLDFINWTYWGPRCAPVLLAVAPVINGARCIRALWKDRVALRSRLRQRGGGGAT